MAKNVYSLQLLRNSTLFANKQDAIEGITSATTQDGVIKLARYTDGSTVKTIFGIYHDFNGGGTTGYTIYDSYKEVIESIQSQISGSTADIEEINQKLGTGVTTTNSVTDQLEALSGSASDTSATASVAGAKKYTDEKVAEAVDGLDYTDTAVAGQYVSQVTETDGVIAVTRAELPTVAAISEAGKPITAVSERLGEISATAGTITAEYVNVADGGNLFSGSTVEAVLAEIDAAYKAADTVLKNEILGGASTSADTLGELETLINTLSAGSATYTIRKDSNGLPAEIKERYTLVETKNGQSTDKQVTIDIPKDSHIVSITYDGTTQKLTYNYIDVSGNTQSTDVDMSELVLETEFASGVTFSNGVAHGVVDPTSETFLTVGADGFKLSGVQDAIDAKIAALDASVNGGTTAGTATADHIQVVVDEVDGKLTAVTVTETNIADADDLAALSAKTVTEIASSNASISATAATADGTVSYDLVTDASKIQMSGFTADASGFTGITAASSITDAIKEIEDAYIATNTELDKKIENIVVNSVSGSVDANIASVTIDGADIKLDDYTSGSSSDAVVTTDTVNQAIGKLENQIKNAVAGGLQQVEAGSGITVSAVANNKQTIDVKLAAAADIPVEENAIKFDATNHGLYIDTLDCGTY